MSSDACRLTKTQREAVEAQVVETCGYRGWHLHAVNCRSNHIHVVVTANETAPKKIRIDLKAYATRCLKKLDETRDDWWAERGSIRWIFNEDDLESAIIYVIDGQDRKPSG